MISKDVLLVEDDERLHAILALNLKRRGHEVRGAHLGAEARRLIAEHMPDVLVLDVNLPDETGWEILRWLRAQPGIRPHVIVLTAFRPSATRIEDLAPDAVLTKPFPIDALSRLVERDEGEAAD